MNKQMSKLTKLKMTRYMKLAGLSLLTAAMILIVAVSLVFVIVIIKDTLTDRLLLNEAGAVATSIVTIIPLLLASFCWFIYMKVTCKMVDVYMNKTILPHGKTPIEEELENIHNRIAEGGK